MSDKPGVIIYGDMGAMRRDRDLIRLSSSVAETPTTPEQHEISLKPDAQTPLDEAINYATRIWSAEVINGTIELVHTLPIPGTAVGNRTRFERRLTLYPSPAHDLTDRISRTAAARFKSNPPHIEAALVTFQKTIEAGNPMTVKEIVSLAMLTQRMAPQEGRDIKSRYSMGWHDFRSFHGTIT